ncbi:ATP-dependent metalloprotease FtsH [Desulfarculus baarsii DSM 2075]|uniref:ATP-dependent zinc metalloprotease FtsH n=1 Tax=Desulfarculus baarsii (strain ATCC 33931 / DSM 2075 / LMG 7858 / VKM B-1802 / 2st14) TaxID=644282 RepID=E1QEZ8_DESB2|nr:ATP-dependent zinc metalloprotease FtsH [Desulfarculus baarsii]ADK84134.1 ATP-dependent metalloprotease FtsH [Desulfarculus baarsii DSM 2075]
MTQGNKPPINPLFKNLALWLVISLMMVLLFNMFNQRSQSSASVSYSEFMDAVDQGQVSRVSIQGQEVSGDKRDGVHFRTFVPDDPELIKNLRAKGVRITAKPADESPWYMTLLASWFPMLLLIGVWIFFMRQMQSGGGKAMSFGKSRAQLMTEPGGRRITFEDVAGVEEAKEELAEIVEFLREPKKFTRLGGRIPKGVLLVGSPGTGKTLLARAIAGEAGVPFFSISGSDFVEMFVGVGASRVRDLFTQGKKQAPCIIFIDEIDAVGRHRGAGLGGGHDEREQTLNQLLVEMDGFESNEGVILIAATNRPDVLDPALLRPGRFDRQVVVPVPDVRGREKVLHVHTRRTPLGPDVDLAVLARGTPGFSGADLENMVNEAALLAARENKDVIGMLDFERAKDKVLMGTERRSLILSDEEKRTTALHEAGHALVAMMLPGTDPVHKVTIIPRGRALGLTQQLPVDERHTYPRDYLVNNLAVFMGGRAAEEVALDKITTGAGNDIERATDLARKMVCEWGMSEVIGPASFGRREEHPFLGRELGSQRDYSERTAVAIDDEVRRFVHEAHETAIGILRAHRDKLDALAAALLEEETLDADAVESIVRGGPRKKAKPAAAPAPPPEPAAPRDLPGDGPVESEPWSAARAREGADEPDA